MGKVTLPQSTNDTSKSQCNRPRGRGITKRLRSQFGTPFSQKLLEDNYKNRKEFDKELFQTTFSKDTIQKSVGILKDVTENEVNSRHLLQDDYIYSIQIISQRASYVPDHFFDQFFTFSYILLPHLVETADSDICLFVRNLKSEQKIDLELTIKHYEEILASQNVTRNITIMPVNRLYNEFATFSSRHKLAFFYDAFLVDKTIATHVNRFLGNKLIMKGRSAIPIDLEADNIVEEIDRSLRTVSYKQINNEIVQLIKVGRHSMANNEIAENVIEVIKHLGAVHPGGSNNINKIDLKTNVNVGASVPIFINTETVEIEKTETVQPDDSVKANEAENSGIPKLDNDLVKDDIVVRKDQDDDKNDKEKTDEWKRLESERVFNFILNTKKPPPQRRIFNISRPDNKKQIVIRIEIE